MGATLLSASASGLHAQTAAPNSAALAVRAAGNQTGSVEGDMYVVLPNGDLKRGAGRLIYIVRDGDSLHTALDTVCASWRAAYRPLAARDKALSASYTHNRDSDAIVAAMREQKTVKITRDSVTRVMRAAVDRVVASFITDSAGSDINAHYRIVGITPGRYILTSAWTIDNATYHWWKPVTVRQYPLTSDLDDRARGAGPYCVDTP